MTHPRYGSFTQPEHKQDQKADDKNSWHRMISLRPILKVRNKIRAKGKQFQGGSPEETPEKDEREDNEDQDILEDLQRNDQELE